MSIMRLDGISKRYGPIVALTKIDFSVERGEFVTLLGPSGSGKTTMLNLVAGMIAPTEGRIFIAGRDVTETPPNRRGLGMVFQNYALMPHMTVFENIAFPLRVRRIPREEIRRKVHEVLQLVQLTHVASRKPRELSGGQQQRISLARSLVYNPSVILMDEPLGALDKKLREQMQIELRRLHDELGITILYVTHDQEEALTMSDRIVLMNNGEIEQIGSPGELYFNPRSVFAAQFLGDSNLLNAQVEVCGSKIGVRDKAGHLFTARESPILEPGSDVKLMVRPENISVSRSDGDRFVNEVEGEIAKSIIIGGVVKHYVRLADGTILVAQELSNRRGTLLCSGDKVRLGWHPDDMHVLP